MTDRDTNDSKSAQQPVMMPAYFPQPSDEIDLFELLEQLWRGKLTILGTMVLALTLGGGASVLNIIPPATGYTVSTTFTHILYPIVAQQDCEGSRKCLDGFANQSLSLLIDDNWLLSGNKLSLVTESPLSEEQYDAQLTAVTNAATDKVFIEARSELILINESLNPALLSTERVATSLLNATRVMATIESDSPAISFEPVLISPPTQPKSKTPNIMAMSLILGSILGSIIVLLRNALQSRRQQSTA
jgi:capsular polysaccharide biosynthesis protein